MNNVRLGRIIHFFEMSDQPANLIELDGGIDDLYAKINAHNGLTVVKLGTTTCTPCKCLNQVLPSIARENETVQFIMIEVDKHPEFKSEFQITSVPNVFFYKRVQDPNPEQVANIVGLKIPEIKAKIAELK